MKRKIILAGNHYSLARLEKFDLGSIKKWRNEQRNILRQNKILTDKDQLAWFKLLPKDKNQKIFSILDSSEKLLGYCGIVHIDWENRNGEISFLLESDTPKNTHQDIFLEVLSLLKRYAFSTLSLHRLFTETFEYRKFHIGILEEFGFKQEGKLTGHIYKNGKFYDSVLHYILNKK